MCFVAFFLEIGIMVVMGQLDKETVILQAYFPKCHSETWNSKSQLDHSHCDSNNNRRIKSEVAPVLVVPQQAQTVHNLQMQQVPVQVQHHSSQQLEATTEYVN